MTVKPVNKKQSWGKQLNPIFKLTSWIHRSGFYKIWKIFPNLSVNIYGRLFGTIFLDKISKSYRSIIPSIQAIFPHKTKDQIKKIYQANIAFLGQFLFRTMFITPRISVKFSKKRTTFKNLEVIDKILEEGKGVIIPSIHLGNFIEGWLGGWIMRDEKYSIAAVASMSNMALFNEIINRPDFDRAIPVSSIEFGSVKDQLIGHLKQNRIVVIMFDYTKETQFRVPFLHGKYPYLQHTPQSVASLHKITGAPIIPAICHPVGGLDKTYVEFLDNTSIVDISKKYWDAPKKILYGMISTEINRILNRYLRVYPHLWEEITNFATFRIADKVQFDSNITIKEFVNQIKDKIISVINYSFEPNRNDNELLSITESGFNDISNNLKNSEDIFRTHKSFVNLSKMEGTAEILKLLRVARNELLNNNESECSVIVEKMIKKIKDI